MSTSLLIRADGSSVMGTGHIMRCMALAHAWRAMGGQVHLLSAYGLPEVLHDRLTHDTIILHSLPADKNAAAGSLIDVQFTLDLAHKIQATSVVVDGYHFGADYQHALKEGGLRLLFIDDNAHADYYSADWILNQNLHADLSLYSSREAYTLGLLGPRYALLRAEFWPTATGPRGGKVVEVARRILVTMGGSDPHNVTAMVLQALEDVSFKAEITAVVGGSNPHYANLQRMISSARQSIRLEQNSTDMLGLMRWADMAISAAGTTVWELARCGLPSLLISVADNQRNSATRLQATQTMDYLGDTNDLQPPAITQAVEALAANPARRQQMRDLSQLLVDGRGAQRVAAVLAAQDTTTNVLRLVEVGDAPLLWAWTNESITRRNSLNPKAVPWDTHVAWFKRKLASPDTRIWLLERGHVPLAMIRYDRQEDDSALISYSVQATHRGQGLGTALLNQSGLLARQALGVHTLRGVTLVDNVASSRAFEKAGYHYTERRRIQGSDCLVFEQQGEISQA